MHDRFLRGFVAGMIAGVPTLVFNWGAAYLHLTTLRWADFMGIFTAGREPTGIIEMVFSTLAVFAWLGILGVVFTAYVIPALSHQNLTVNGS